MERASNILMELLEKNPDKTCFILKDDQIIFSSEHKGVKPIMDYYAEFGPSAEPLTVVDKIIGKGAIILAILIGADRVITPVISQSALDFAVNFKIKAEYLKVVPYIVNHTNDGQCPIECSVMEINEVRTGYEVIRETLLKLNEKNL